MAMIRQADLERIPKDALRLNLGDLKAQGERIIEEAKGQAKEMVLAGQRERARLVADAEKVGHAQGFAKGHGEGLAKGREEGKSAALAEMRERLAKIEKAWGEALAGFERERQRVLREARVDVLRLAVMAAEKVTKRRLEVEPGVVAEQLASAIAEVAKPTGLVVSVHPEDEGLAAEAMPGLLARLGAGGADARLVVDGALARGSCVVRSAGGGVVDASIQTQLARISETLLPGAPKVGAGGGS